MRRALYCVPGPDIDALQYWHLPAVRKCSHYLQPERVQGTEPARGDDADPHPAPAEPALDFPRKDERSVYNQGEPARTQSALAETAFPSRWLHSVYQGMKQEGRSGRAGPPTHQPPPTTARLSIINRDRQEGRSMNEPQPTHSIPRYGRRRSRDKTTLKPETSGERQTSASERAMGHPPASPA